MACDLERDVTFGSPHRRRTTIPQTLHESQQESAAVWLVQFQQGVNGDTLQFGLGNQFIGRS